MSQPCTTIKSMSDTRSQRPSTSLSFAVAALLFVGSTPASLAAPSKLTVLLFQAEADSDSLYIDGPFRLTKPSPQTFPKKRFLITYKQNAFEIRELDPQFGKQATPAQKIRAPFLTLEAAGGRFISIGRRKEKIRRYFGSIRLSSPDGQKLVCRNIVNRRDYVTCVVGSESPAEFPIEALKALSILIQTATVRIKADDQLNDTTEKQAYMGADFARAEVVAAVDKTWGQKLVCGDQLVPVYFHSTCAGGTSSSEIFTGKIPKLPCDKAIACKYCADSPFFKPLNKSISEKEFQSKIADEIPKVQTKDASGRPLQVTYANGKSETGYQLWLRIGQKINWGVAPGTRFDLSKRGDAVQIRSTGAGHGVGLCQWGSKGLAKKGWDFRKILQFYFPGSRILQEA